MASPARASPLMVLLGTIFFLSTNVLAVAAVLGVDLGTEFIKAALVKPGIPLEIVLTKDSRRKETSAVAFKPAAGLPKDNIFPERAYGADAMALAARFPGEVYPNLKALLGLPIDDPIVQEYSARHPALQLEAHSSRNTAAFKTKTLMAEEDAWMVEELLAMELQSIQKNAEVAAGDGTSVRSVVLTIPPFYTTEEKRAVQMAAELAGLRVLTMMSDGLAVGLNYATSRQFPNINDGEKPEYHMVFDMGAGSTKATVMKFQSRTVPDYGKYNKTVQEVQVLGSGWDRTLGGDSLNYLIVDDMISSFIDSKGGKSVSASAESVKAHGRAIAKLTKDAERARHVLSANQNTQASFEGLYEDVDFKYKISRTDFETMAKQHEVRVGNVISEALKMSGLDMIDLDTVILHGGVCRTPFVQKALETIVGSSEKLRSNVNSDEAAVFGAGFRAAELSPSFRVKEIRVSEGAMYQAGLKWDTGSEGPQRQRLWSTVSPLGATPKEITFPGQADFTATIYQQIGTEDSDLKVLTTQNLTATVAEMKSLHPSCAESEITFTLGLKLSRENGEVEVAKATVDCMAEVKEGFVDGVKNLFGFGKKDEKASDEADDSPEDPSEKTEEQEVPATDDEWVGEEADAEAAPKMELVSIPVKVALENTGRPALTKDQLAASKDRLKAFASSDKARLLREEALNQLEGFTYKVRDLLEVDSFVGASTDAERKALVAKSSATSEWLYDDGADALRDELLSKLKELKTLVNPIQKRVDEAAGRPGLISSLKESLDSTVQFQDVMRQQIREYEEWHAAASASASDAAPSETPADFDGLEDEDKERTMEDVVEEKGPIPPLYTIEDLDVVDLLRKTTSEWLEEIEAKQSKLLATDNPLLLLKDLQAKKDALEKAGKDLALKGVKNFDKSKSKKSKSKTKTATADKPGQTINFGGEDGLTPEQMEEVMKRLEEEMAKQKGDKHDEL